VRACVCVRALTHTSISAFFGIIIIIIVVVVVVIVVVVLILVGVTYNKMY